MTGRKQIRAVTLAALLVLSTFSMVGVGAATASAGNDSAGNAAETTFHVSQNGECYSVSAFGDGTQSVEEYYDYRKPSENEEHNYTYSSLGTTHLQENQNSSIFVYHGSEGYSLVMVHDQLDVDNQDAPYGSTITFEFSNMGDGEWAVRDDNYTDPNGNPQDDNWNTSGSNHTVDWKWAEHRTDGGAYRGIAGEQITIDPAFNEQATEWENWAYAGDDANKTEAWNLLGNGSRQELSMTDSITISQGDCSDVSEPSTSPTADFTVSDSTVANDETVTFDANNSSDDGTIETYEWDFDGDGSVDETTEESSTAHSYDEPGDYTVELTVTDDDGESDTATETVTVWNSSTEGSIEYINKSAVEVTGEFERVWIREVWYNEEGLASEKFTLENVSGTTTFSTFHEGMNGSAITSVSAHKSAGGASDIHKENPYDYDIRPEPVNISVADVTETDDGVYDVTFAYENPNDERMIAAYHTRFTSGNVEDEPPTTFYPGENTTTVTWTPAANDERVTLDVDLSNFDLDNESASTQSASEYGGAGDGSDGNDGDDGNDSPTDGEPTAKLSLTKQTADFDQKVGYDASASTDDGDVVEYRWDFDGDGDVDRTTPDDATGKNNPAHTVWHEVYKLYDETGTYTATVTVVDDDGHTDTASAEVTITEDATPPSATLHVPDEATVGDKVEVKATDFTEDDLKHVCWKIGGHDKPDGTTATHTFEEAGEYDVTLRIVDQNGNANLLERTITVTAADDGSDGSNGEEPNDGQSDDPPENGLDDDPNEGNTGGGVPAADPPEDDSNDQSNGNDDRTPNEAAFDGTEDASVEIVLHSDATDATVEATESVPDDARQATAELDGFEALSYATVSGAEDFDATFTVSKDRLESAAAVPEDVTLFRFEDGSWNAVETEQLNETDDAFRFGANATNGTYAVGVGVPSTAIEDLRVASDRVAPGDDLTVTVTVENDGHASGTQDVALTVDGETVATKSVSVEADSTAEVEFTRSFDAPGVYAVSAGDANAEVVVEGIETTASSDDDSETATTTATETASTDGPGVPGFGVGAALVALAAAALLARRQV